MEKRLVAGRAGRLLHSSRSLSIVETDFNERYVAAFVAKCAAYERHQTDWLRLGISENPLED